MVILVEMMKFSKNWNNKLDRENFTTIQEYRSEKWNFYRGQIGSPFMVTVAGKFHSYARLVDVKKMRMEEMSEDLLREDTGFETVEAKKILYNFTSRSLWKMGEKTMYIVLYFEKMHHTEESA